MQRNSLNPSGVVLNLLKEKTSIMTTSIENLPDMSELKSYSKKRTEDINKQGYVINL